MTKAQIINALHEVGEVWANDSYPKKYLEDYLNNYNKAREMTDEELLAMINKRKEK